MDKEIKEKLHIEKVVNTGRLYPMKEACEQTGLAYETLKFYCNIGLVPGVKRDQEPHMPQKLRHVHRGNEGIPRPVPERPVHHPRTKRNAHEKTGHPHQKA